MAMQSYGTAPPRIGKTAGTKMPKPPKAPAVPKKPGLINKR